MLSSTGLPCPTNAVLTGWRYPTCESAIGQRRVSPFSCSLTAPLAIFNVQLHQLANGAPRKLHHEVCKQVRTGAAVRHHFLTLLTGGNVVGFFIGRALTLLPLQPNIKKARDYHYASASTGLFFFALLQSPCPEPPGAFST